MLPLALGNIIKQIYVKYYCYADDTQLYVSISPENPSSFNALLTCLNDVNMWMRSNFLKQNEQKTEIVIVGPKS